MTANNESGKLTFKNMTSGDWPIYPLLIAMAVAGILFYPHLPGTVPTHWGPSGQADGFSSKTFAVLFTPLLSIAIYFLLIGVPFIDPESANIAGFLKSYRMLRFTIHFFLFGMYIVSLVAGLGYKVDMGRVVNIGIGALFIVIGYLMTSFSHNYTIGIRIPWTLASPEVWDKTHRFARKYWIGAGAATMLGAFFGWPLGLIIMMISIAVAAIVPSVYAYHEYRKLK
jgi:uncharacterized membrane protein